MERPSWHSSLQAEAFRRAVTNLHLTNSLFSLTGGLDTRAVLAVLSKTAARPTACTMSGSPAVCLDARLAMALCREYRLDHVLVTLGEQYVRDLPAHVVEASRLSGGLASLDQAHEVYFNRQLNGVGSRRLSGNLGNQLARRGLEAYATRDAAFDVLNEGLARAASVQRQQHWLDSATRNSESTLLQLLLECEAPFSSIGNFSIGQHFMIQQTPYANRLLIEMALRSPLQAGASEHFKARQARPTTRRSSFFRSGTSALVPVQRDTSGGRCRCPLSDQLGLARGRRYLTARTRLGCSRLRRCSVDDVLRLVCPDSENPECSGRFWSGRDQAIPVVAGHRLAGVRQRYASFEAGGREWVIQRRCSGPSVGRALRWHQLASRHDSRHLGSGPRTPDFCSVLG